MKIQYQKQQTPAFQIDLTDGSRIFARDSTNRLEFSSSGQPAVDLNDNTQLDINVDENWLRLTCVDNADQLRYSYLVPTAEIKRVTMGTIQAH